MAVTPANVKYGIAKISIGTAGQSSTMTDCGYTEDGVEISFSPEVSEIEVDEAYMPLDVVMMKQVITVKATLAETTAGNLKAAIAGIDSGATALAGSAVYKYALKVDVCPTNRDQTTTMSFTFLNGYSTSTTLAYKKGDKWLAPLEYKAIGDITGAAIAYPACDINPA